MARMLCVSITNMYNDLAAKRRITNTIGEE